MSRGGGEGGLVGDRTERELRREKLNEKSDTSLS